MAPIAISSDLSKIDVCGAIPKEEIEAVIGTQACHTAGTLSNTTTPGSSDVPKEAGARALAELVLASSA